MKNILIISTLLLTSFSFAQIGVKAGLTYNADEGLYTSAENAYTDKGKGSIGYHVALYKRFNITGLYIQPELWYVSYKNEFNDFTNKNLEVQYQRIDVPVSIGTTILSLGYLQAGPVLSYYFEDEINVDEISQVEQEDISLALQVGAGVSVQNLDISLRYDFPLGERETKWVENKDYNFQTENTPKLLHISVGYNF